MVYNSPDASGVCGFCVRFWQLNLPHAYGQNGIGNAGNDRFWGFDLAADECEPGLCTCMANFGLGERGGVSGGVRAASGRDTRPGVVVEIWAAICCCSDGIDIYLGGGQLDFAGGYFVGRFGGNCWLVGVEAGDGFGGVKFEGFGIPHPKDKIYN